MAARRACRADRTALPTGGATSVASRPPCCTTRPHCTAAACYPQSAPAAARTRAAGTCTRNPTISALIARLRDERHGRENREKREKREKSEKRERASSEQVRLAAQVANIRPRRLQRSALRRRGDLVSRERKRHGEPIGQHALPDPRGDRLHRRLRLRLGHPQDGRSQVQANGSPRRPCHATPRTPGWLASCCRSILRIQPPRSENNTNFRCIAREKAAT